MTLINAAAIATRPHVGQTIPVSRPQTDFSKLTVVVPTLNEVGAITELLTLVTGLMPGCRVVVADDGSTDGTPDAVKLFSKRIALRQLGGSESTVVLLDRKSKDVHGITASVIDALERCDTEYLAVIDGDLQHPPAELVRILDRLSRGASIVVGCRSSFAGEYPRVRFAISRIAAIFARFKIYSSALQVRDPMSGLFGVRTELFRSAWEQRPDMFEMRGYKVLFDLLRIVSDRRFPSAQPLRVAEVEYHFETRKQGSSKLSSAHAWYFLRSLFRS